MNIYEQVQRALSKLGYDIGQSEYGDKAFDGIPGRYYLKAVEKFQAKMGLPITGIADTRVLNGLHINEPKTTQLPPWIEIGLKKMGLNERTNKKELMQFLGSDGHALGDPSVMPWCGDYAETCVALALPSEPILITTRGNPYWAQNWTGFGLGLKEPSPGAILVFTRNGGGHVAFYLGEDKTYFFILGGNQSNSISIMRIDKKRLAEDGIRWPKTFPLPTAGRNITTMDAALSTNEA